MALFPRLAAMPPYVFTTMAFLKQQIAATGAEIFDFGLGNPDQPTPPHVVEELQKAALNPSNHRYGAPRGMLELRQSIANWYGKRFDVDLDPHSETIVTIGSKEGIAHLALALLDSTTSVLVPDPCYPVHYMGCIIAGANVISLPLSTTGEDFLKTLEDAIKNAPVKPKLLILNFPSNPTTQCVDITFFENIIELAKEHSFWVMHDFAYADLVFDGYRAPSILQVKGAKDVAVEAYTLSKSYNMAGWRIGFMCGNPKLIEGLAKIKSYVDYGACVPAQMAAIAALEGPQDCVTEICRLYQDRRDFFTSGLKALNWTVEVPKATMFLWLKIPKPFEQLGSFEFAKLLLQQAHVVVSPGIGFGKQGDAYVRISLVENDERVQQALNNIQQFMHCQFEWPNSLEYVPT